MLWVMKDVQGVSSPGREAEAAVEQRVGFGSQADQVLVPKQEDPDEGTPSAYSFPLLVMLLVFILLLISMSSALAPPS